MLCFLHVCCNDLLGSKMKRSPSRWFQKFFREWLKIRSFLHGLDIRPLRWTRIQNAKAIRSNSGTWGSVCTVCIVCTIRAHSILDHENSYLWRIRAGPSKLTEWYRQYGVDALCKTNDLRDTMDDVDFIGMVSVFCRTPLLSSDSALHRESGAVLWIPSHRGSCWAGQTGRHVSSLVWGDPVMGLWSVVGGDRGDRRGCVRSGCNTL